MATQWGLYKITMSSWTTLTDYQEATEPHHVSMHSIVAPQEDVAREWSIKYARTWGYTRKLPDLEESNFVYAGRDLHNRVIMALIDSVETIDSILDADGKDIGG